MISERLSELDELGDSFLFEGAAEDSLPGLFLGPPGVPSFDGPDGVPAAGGSPSAGFAGTAPDEVSGGFLSDLAGAVAPGDCLSTPAAGRGELLVFDGVSTLPSMIGNPSLPDPITTIFELGDLASARVASMPRQRKYESEIPSLTVRWKAAMPFASTLPNLLKPPPAISLPS